MTWTATLAAAAALTFTDTFSAFAQDDKAAAGVSREEVLATGATIVDQPITYPTGAAKLTAEMVSFEPGGHTALHTQPVPSSMYNLEGEL